MSDNLRNTIRNIIKEYYDIYPDFFDPLANPNIGGFIGKKKSNGISKVAVNEEIVEEGAKSFMDLNSNFGLVEGEGGFRGKFVSLFNFKENKCYAYAFLGEFSEKSYGLINIASEPGYGPLISECAMMSVYPKGICIDRVGETREKVWNMFDIFSSNRGDISKKIISEKDLEYDDRYLNIGDEKKHYLMNLIFLRTPSAWYKKYINRGNHLMSEHEISKEKIREISRAFFTEKYNSL